MNDLTLVRDAAPETAAPSAATLQRARAALMAEIAAERAPRPRRFRAPRRRTAVRIGVGLTAVAAAWSAAVVIAAPDGPGTPADSVTLVDVTTPTFPLSLDPVPDGLRPAFDGDGEGSSIASYEDAAAQNGFTIYVGEDRPESGEEGSPDYESAGTEEVSVDGVEADLVRYSRTWCTGDATIDCGRRSFTSLTWERAHHQWVRIVAHGRYRSPARIIGIAASLVDRAQPATLRVGLAPAGWSIKFFKMGRVLTIANDADEQQTVTVHLPLPEDVVPPDRLRSRLMGPVGPLLTVPVHGRPAQLVRIDAGGQDTGWYLQAQFQNGTTFVVQAPQAFTQAQVIAFADQVTYTP